MTGISQGLATFAFGDRIFVAYGQLANEPTVYIGFIKGAPGPWLSPNLYRVDSSTGTLEAIGRDWNPPALRSHLALRLDQLIQIIQDIHVHGDDPTHAIAAVTNAAHTGGLLNHPNLLKAAQVIRRDHWPNVGLVPYVVALETAHHPLPALQAFIKEMLADKLMAPAAA